MELDKELDYKDRWMLGLVEESDYEETETSLDSRDCEDFEDELENEEDRVLKRMWDVT